jgi:putative ABC transport system substrate-binding protein
MILSIKIIKCSLDDTFLKNHGDKMIKRLHVNRFTAVLWILTFFSIIGYGTLVAAADDVLQVCVTKIVSHAALDAAEKGFEYGLANAGFKEGENITYTRRDAEGDPVKADTIAQEFAQADCDLIHTISTPTTQSVLKYVDKIPVIFSAVTDPEGAGIVPVGSAAGSKTDTHVTGVSDKWPVVLQMRTYAKFVPEAKTWGTIYNPDEDNSVSHVSEMRNAMNALGLQLIEVHATNAIEVEAAARSLLGSVQAIAITADNTSVAHFELIAKICNEHKIALFAGDVDSVPKGAITAYAT